MLSFEIGRFGQSQPIFRLLAEVLCEAIDVISVGVDGANGHVAEEHILSHSLGNWSKTLSKRSHRNGLLSEVIEVKQTGKIARDFSMIAVTKSAIPLIALIVNRARYLAWHVGQG